MKTFKFSTKFDPNFQIISLFNEIWTPINGRWSTNDCGLRCYFAGGQGSGSPPDGDEVMKNKMRFPLQNEFILNFCNKIYDKFRD